MAGGRCERHGWSGGRAAVEWGLAVLLCLAALAAQAMAVRGQAPPTPAGIVVTAPSPAAQTSWPAGTAAATATIPAAAQTAAGTPAPMATPTPTFLGYVQTYAPTAQNLLASLAILFGSIAAYYKFIKGRVFVPRLSVSVEGDLFQHGSKKAVRVRMAIKNVGLSRVDFNDPEKINVTLSIEAIRPEDYLPKVVEVRSETLGKIDVFRRHTWVEPGEEAKEEAFVPLPQTPEALVYLLELKVSNHSKKWFFWDQWVNWKAVNFVGEGLQKPDGPGETAEGRARAARGERAGNREPAAGEASAGGVSGNVSKDQAGKEKQDE